MKPGSQFEQCADTSADVDVTRRRPQDAGSQFEEVLLPLPLRPIMPTLCPGSTVNETSAPPTEILLLFCMKRAVIESHTEQD